MSTPILITNSNCQLIRELFDGWRFDEIAWAYGMNSSKASNEILIRNF